MRRLLRPIREVLYLRRRDVPHVTDGLLHAMADKGVRIMEREREARIQRIMRAINRRNRR